MVCGAPTPCSSGGRSAVSTSIGTSDRPASTTAGWKLAAAVPLVHSSSAGRPGEPEAEGDERRRPLVVDDVHRQLVASGERQRHRRAARARRDDGVARRRGATHSSTSVAQNVACTVGGGLARSHRPRTIRA